MSMLTRVFSGRLFLTCAAALGAMALGMKPAAEATGRWLEKRPVPIRKPLARFDANRLPSFSAKGKVDLLDKSEIGTQEYGAWRFASVAEDLKWKGELGLTASYYTQDGVTMTFQIPHTPEVCYRQAGTQVTDSGEFDVSLETDGGTVDSLRAKYFRMSNSTATYNKDIIVAYVLCVNGSFCTDREVARALIALPWNRAVYFAKIECSIDLSTNDRPADALQAGKRLLTEASRLLVQEHLPTQADLEVAANTAP